MRVLDEQETIKQHAPPVTPADEMPGEPEVSVFLPVYNEEPNLRPLHAKLDQALKSLGRSAEIVYVDEFAAVVKVRADDELLELKLATNSVPKIDLATQQFVNDHTRAHELHQRREALRIARERAEAARLQATQATLETQPHSPAEEAILESGR